MPQNREDGAPHAGHCPDRSAPTWALYSWHAQSISQAQPIVDPGQPEPGAELVHYGVGVYFQSRGSHERAIPEFTAAIEALPLAGDAYAARADSYVSLKQYAPAVADYTQVLVLNGEDPLTCAKRAFAFAALGDQDAAQQDFERVMAMSSASPS